MPGKQPCDPGFTLRQVPAPDEILVHTDLFEWRQRGTPFSLSAEIQRRLLPGAFACEAGAFTLAG